MSSGNNTAPTLSIIVPIFNEADVIQLLAERLKIVFSLAQCVENKIAHIEYIFVDDGSQDESSMLLSQFFEVGREAKIIRFSRNFGHQPAVTAGLEHSSGDLVAIIDADLQDPPELIWQMIDQWRAGFDVVYGLRVNRKENRIKRIAYWGFYRVYRWLSPIQVPVDSGDFCLMSRRVVNQINALPERLRFVRGLRSWVGFKQCGITYDRPERAAGATKYNFHRLYKLATDGIASLSVRPLQVAQVLALSYLLASIVLTLFITYRLLLGQVANPEIYLLILLLLFSNSLILFSIYVLGAYIGRSYQEIKGRPTYIIQEIIQ